LPLRQIAARAIVSAVADAAERWTDADFPPRVRATAAIEARLGYSMPVVDYALDRLFGGITAAALDAAVASELGSVAALDAFVAHAGRPAAWARGVDRVSIVVSDATIGVAIAPLVYALCAKSRVVVHDRGDALIAAFAHTLGEALPALRDAVDVQTWTGDDAAVRGADVVVAFGGAETLRAIRAACDAGAAFVPFGHAASAAYVDHASLAGDLGALTAAIARDALLHAIGGGGAFDLIFLERCDEAGRERFVRALAEACEAGAIEFPPGTREHAAVPGTVVVVGGIPDAAAYVARHEVALRAVGVPPGFGDDAAEDLAAQLGALRVATLGDLATPPLGGHFGGRARIADFVRWVDRE